MNLYMDVYTKLTPSEAVVYLRLSLMAENGKVRARFADVARLANISRATMKRVMHSLKARGLVEVSWQQKSPAVFTLRGGEIKDAAARPKLYDQFSPEDRELYLLAKRSIAPREMQEIEREALEQGEGHRCPGCGAGIGSGAVTEVRTPHRKTIVPLVSAGLGEALMSLFRYGQRSSTPRG